MLKWVCSLLWFASSAHAMDVVNQTLTPAAGQSEVRANLNYFSESVQGNGGTSTFSGIANTFFFDPSETDQNLAYNYGITNYVALGLGVGYMNIKGTGQGAISSETGLTGLTIGCKGNWNMSSATLYTALVYETPLGTSNTSIDSSGSVTSNGYPNQSSLEAVLGTFADFTSMLLGALISYTDNFQGNSTYSTANGASSTYTWTGGNVLSIAPTVELKNDFHPNLQLIYGQRDSATATTSNGSAYTSNIAWFGLEASSRIDLAPGWQLLDNIGYSFLTNKGTLSSASYFQLGLGVRYVF